MTLLSREITIFSSRMDILSKDADWTRDQSKSTRVGRLEDRYYYYSHSCGWQTGQIIWAALQTILSLGLALISDYTRRTWQQGCSGKEWAIVHIHHKSNDDSNENPPNPITTPQKPQKPLPNNPSAIRPPKPIVPTTPIVTLPPVTPNKPVAKQPAKIQNTGIVVDPNQMDFTGFSRADAKLFRDIEKIFPLINGIEESIGKKEFDQSIAKKWSAQAPVEELKRVFNEILAEFKKDNHRTAFSFIRGLDDSLFNIYFGQQVPEYFANVSNGSSGYSLRYRALLGMRNLVQYGAEILDELNAKLFVPGRDDYTDFPLEGLRKLFYYTGNAVDLEWPLGDTITDTQAIDHAKKLIAAFKIRFASFGDRLKQRNLDNWTEVVPSTTSHTDRGRYPVWKRNNNYFANVPNVPAVVSAILKGPLLLAQSYLILKSKKKPMNDLFDDKSLSMKCFNDKLEKAQEYNLECQELLKPTPKSIAVTQYGQAAVDTALIGTDLDTLFEDDKIRPPKNEKATKELKEMQSMRLKDQKVAYAAWKARNMPAHIKMVKEKVDAFVAKAEKMNWKNVLFYDGKIYRLFDRNVIEEQLESIIAYEHQNLLSTMEEEVHYI